MPCCLSQQHSSKQPSMGGWTAGVVGTHTTLSQEANPSTCHSVGERLCYAE